MSAFLDRKRFDIAILKSLGADGQLVFLAFFLQVMAIAAAALLLGASVGAGAPFLIASIYKDSLPLPPALGIYPGPLLLAAGFGLLSAIAFSVPPLSRARAIPPASLLRDTVEPVRRRPSLATLAVAGGAALVIAALTLALAPSPLYAGEFLGGAVVLLALLRLIAEGLTRGLRKIPRPRSPLLRLALGDLTRPQAAAGGVITALGLGLTLLATVTLLQRTIAAELTEALPGRAPSFFFVDIQPDQAEAFDRTIAAFRSRQDYKRTPMIRGRITALNGVPSAQVRIDADAKWVLNGDRGITYAATPPPGTHVTRGTWWPENYAGPTLVSLDQSVADAAHLNLGDGITLNVLGREIQGCHAADQGQLLCGGHIQPPAPLPAHNFFQPPSAILGPLALIGQFRQFFHLLQRPAGIDPSAARAMPSAGVAALPAATSAYPALSSTISNPT